MLKLLHDIRLLQNLFFFFLTSGKSVLNQKSELQKALQRQKERQFISAHYEPQSNSQNPLRHELGKVITERAQKLENHAKEIDNNSANTEFNEEYLKIRAKLRANANAI